MDEKLAKYAHGVLERRGVKIHLKCRLQNVTATGANFLDTVGNRPLFLPSRTCVSTIPSGPTAPIRELKLPLTGGRVPVDEFLRVPGYEGLWAAGDCVAVPQPDGITSPPTAQHALRQAKTCAHNLLASLRGAPLKKFDFTGLGKLGSLGRYCAVAEIKGHRLKGFLAWLLWRAVYLSKFPGLDRKLRVATDWLEDLVIPKDITGLCTREASEVRQEHFEPNDWIFRQGDFGDKVFFIVQGELEVVRDQERLNVLKAGDTFGEMALMSKSSRMARADAGGRYLRLA